MLTSFQTTANNSAPDTTVGRTARKRQTYSGLHSLLNPKGKLQVQLLRTDTSAVRKRGTLRQELAQKFIRKQFFKLAHKTGLQAEKQLHSSGSPYQPDKAPAEIEVPKKLLKQLQVAFSPKGAFQFSDYEKAVLALKVLNADATFPKEEKARFVSIVQKLANTIGTGKEEIEEPEGIKRIEVGSPRYPLNRICLTEQSFNKALPQLLQAAQQSLKTWLNKDTLPALTVETLGKGVAELPAILRTTPNRQVFNQMA